MLLSSYESLGLDSSHIIVTSDALSIVSSYDNIYLFTMGSKQIFDIVIKCQSLGKEVFYQDCYFSLEHYSKRFVNPLLYLFPKYRSHFCPPLVAIKQILKQLWFDPFQKSIIFSADSHCWPVFSIISSLSFPNIQPFRLTPVLSMPSKSLLFTLNSCDNKLPIDWDLFKSSGYDLYYKPHPLPSSDYAHYPYFVKPYAKDVDPSQIYFRNDSFLVSLFSFSLSSTIQSISLARIFHNNIHPLNVLYCNLATYLPSDSDQLTTLLSRTP